VEKLSNTNIESTTICEQQSTAKSCKRKQFHCMTCRYSTDCHTISQCCCQGLETQGRGQGRGLENWSSM